MNSQEMWGMGNVWDRGALECPEKSVADTSAARIQGKKDNFGLTYEFYQNLVVQEQKTHMAVA